MRSTKNNRRQYENNAEIFNFAASNIEYDCYDVGLSKALENNGAAVVGDFDDSLIDEHGLYFEVKYFTRMRSQLYTTIFV